MSSILKGSDNGKKINDPDEPASGTVGSTASNRKSTDTILDQEYVRLMEESYGIREEGVF
jgi:hypothetical protein